MTNGNTQYKIGELSQGFKNLEERLDRLEGKVDNLNIWRWKVVGSTSVISVFITVLITYLFK